MADLQAVQSRLSASLDAVGYSKAVGTLPASLERNKKLCRFVELVAEQTKPANYLNPEQARSYEDLKSTGQVVEGQALESALQSLGQDTQRAEEVEREVENMANKVTNLKKQLQTLNCIQKSLSEHYASLLHKRDELTRQKSDMLRHQHSAQQRAEDGGKQVDAALQDLMAAVKELCSFHRPGEGGKATHPPKFLFNVSQDGFHQAEDQYLKELTEYTKKQFFKGLADLAHSCAPGEADTKFSEVDLADSDTALLRGVTEEQHQRHRQELSRLQALYPRTEVECINSQLAKKYAEVATNRAKHELQTLSQQNDEVNCEVLSQQLVESQRRTEGLRARMQELGHTQLTSLLQDMAALQVTRVLHGDYDLKIARQDYFTSKQDKVISDLQSQRSRHDLLSILYESELRKHRDTHRLLSTAEKQLTQLKEEGDKRSVAMQIPTLRLIDAPRTSIDSKDKFAHRLCALLDVKPSSSVPVVSHASLQKAVEQLVHQIATLQGIVGANHAEMRQLCQKQELLTGLMEKELFGRNGDQPKLTVEGYSNLCSKLGTVVSSLEQNIKALLKDYDGKKKVLQADALLQTEKMLFVHFFTEPDRLSRIVSDLAKRVDSIALANQ